MSEAKSELLGMRRTFTPEFKADAVRLVTDAKYTFQAAVGILPAFVDGRRLQVNEPSDRKTINGS